MAIPALVVKIAAKTSGLMTALNTAKASMGAFAAKAAAGENAVGKLGKKGAAAMKSIGAAAKKAGGIAAGAFKTLGSILGSVAKWGGGLALVFGGGLWIALNRTAQTIDDMAKNSRRLGITVADYQRMQFVFAQTGISGEQANKAFIRMIANINDSAMGMGEAHQAFQALNMDSAELAKLAPWDQFKAISKAVREFAGTNTERIGAVYDIVGGRGTGMISTMLSDIEALEKEFDSFGITLTRTMGEAAEEFNDSKDVLDTMFSGFFQNVTAYVSPAFSKFNRYLQDSIVGMGGLKEAAKIVADLIVKGFGTALKIVPDLIEGMYSFYKTTIKVSYAVLDMVNSLGRAFGASIDTRMPIIDALRSMGETIDGFDDKFISAESSAGKFFAGIGKMGETILDINKNGEQFAKLDMNNPVSKFIAMQKATELTDDKLEKIISKLEGIEGSEVWKDVFNLQEESLQRAIGFDREARSILADIEKGNVERANKDLQKLASFVEQISADGRAVLADGSWGKPAAEEMKTIIEGLALKMQEAAGGGKKQLEEWKVELEAATKMIEANAAALKNLNEVAAMGGDQSAQRQSAAQIAADAIAQFAAATPQKAANDPVATATQQMASNVVQLTSTNSQGFASVNQTLKEVNKQSDGAPIKLSLDMTTDTGKVAVELWGYRTYTDRLKNFVAAHTRAAAKKAAGG